MGEQGKNIHAETTMKSLIFVSVKFQGFL